MDNPALSLCLNNLLFRLNYYYTLVFAANGSKFQMRAITWCPKCNQVKLFLSMALQKTQTVLLPTLLIENTSLICCHWYGNTNCRIILIATTAFGCMTQLKEAWLLSRQFTVIKMLFLNKKTNKQRFKGKHFRLVHLNNILAMSSKFYQILWKNHTISLLILAGGFILF